MKMSGSVTTTPEVSKHFTSSILLWMRTDQPRQAGMDRWKGPHSGIVSATPGLLEYRQTHLAEHNPGRWPNTSGVETAIPEDRRIDGIAEVTFELLAPHVSAIHAYDVDAALTYVKNGKILPHYEE